MIDTDLERRLAELRRLDETGLTLDIGRAWRDLTLLRHRDTGRRRRRRAVGAAVLAAAAVAAILAGPVLARGPHSTAPGHTVGPSGSSTPSFPGAVVARIPVSGVHNLTESGSYAWVLAQASVSGEQQLVRISLATNNVTLRIPLGIDQDATVAAGNGGVWVTTRYGQARGQILRLDPATGRVVSTLHLPAGPCTNLAYSSGGIWTTCAVTRGTSRVLLLSPATGKPIWSAGPVPRFNDSLAETPDSFWYIGSTTIKGLVRDGSGVRTLTVRDPSYPVGFGDDTDTLVYAAGYLWALTTDESVAKINPATGTVMRIYTYRTYDPRYRQGLNFLAVGHRSLWFLDDGPLNVRARPRFGVLRVSMSTGLPVGVVPAWWQNACGEPCFQIDSTPSSIWVPTSGQLIRIDPALLPASRSAALLHRS
jgi:hypothetical protein